MGRGRGVVDGQGDCAWVDKSRNIIIQWDNFCSYYKHDSIVVVVL